jgi:hypothetical protein
MEVTGRLPPHAVAPELSRNSPAVAVPPPSMRCRPQAKLALASRRQVTSIRTLLPMSRARARLPGLIARHAAVKISSCQTLRFLLK